MNTELIALLQERQAEAHRVIMRNLNTSMFGDYDNATSKPAPIWHRMVHRARAWCGEKVFKLACAIAGEDRWTDY